MTSRRAFLASVAAVPAAASLFKKNGLSNEFFAMDPAMVDAAGHPPPPAVINVLAELHYKGATMDVGNDLSWKYLMEQILPQIEKDGLKLYGAYSWVHIGRDHFEIDPGISANIAALQTSGAAIWLPITSKEFKPSDAAGDDLVAAAVRQISDEAQKYGLPVVLYPHFGNLIQRVADAARICEKVNRPNVGLTFNLCHWLRADGPDSLHRVMAIAAPHLRLVTINGADRDGHDWDRLIQPLDSGTYDVGLVLRQLRKIRYHGPIGLQGYQVARHFHIEPAENLRRSMAAWQKLAARA